MKRQSSSGHLKTYTSSHASSLTIYLHKRRLNNYNNSLLQQLQTLKNSRKFKVILMISTVVYLLGQSLRKSKDLKLWNMKSKLSEIRDAGSDS